MTRRKKLVVFSLLPRRAMGGQGDFRRCPPLPLLAQDLDGEVVAEPHILFAQMTEGEAVVEDYISMRLTLRSHPMAILRPYLTGGKWGDSRHYLIVGSHFL